MKFYTSDTHFSSERTLSFSKRPFLNTLDMDKDIKDKWNKNINKNDIVYHLGDFGNYNFIKKLNGNVILIMGNYEEKDMQENFNNDFNLFKEYLIELGFKHVIRKNIEIPFEYNEESLILNLCHKPEDCNKNKFNLFGHIHSLQMVRTYGLNVSVDAHHFYPLNEEDIKFYINAIKNHYDENVFK